MSEDRDQALQMAGALQVKVDDIFARNDELEAECASLRVAFEAVSAENAALRTSLDKRTRQRDAAARTADLLDEKMRKIQAVSSEAMRAIHPVHSNEEPSTANLAFLKRPAG